LVQIQVRPYYMEENLQEIERNPFEGWEISLQKELISEWLSENSLKNIIENKTRWIEDYSKKYREIIETHPQFVEEYETDKNGIKQQIKDLLYEKTIN
jgi:hypothetical protein